ACRAPLRFTFYVLVVLPPHRLVRRVDVLQQAALRQLFADEDLELLLLQRRLRHLGGELDRQHADAVPVPDDQVSRGDDRAPALDRAVLLDRQQGPGRAGRAASEDWQAETGQVWQVADRAVDHQR